MRLVSYTRTTSSFAGAVLSNNEITEQNSRIKAYADAQGWRVSEKYSDRKKDENEKAAFEQLVQDGVLRKYDAVIFDSVFRVGKELWTAKEVLAQTLFYAGIGFIIVEDDFISMEKTRDEIDNYFQLKYNLQTSQTVKNIAKERNQRGCSTNFRAPFGYRLSKEGRLEIDEQMAAVVQRMFVLCADGMTAADIAKILQEEKVPVPGVFQETKRKIANPYNWKSSSVRLLLTRQIYTGYWSKIVDGQELSCTNDPIVDEDTFQKVQKYLKETGTAKAEQQNYSKFRRLLYDRESGEPLIMRKSHCKMEPYVTLQKMPECYVGTRRIHFSKLETMIREILDQEHQKAVAITKRIQTDGEQKKAALIEELLDSYKKDAFLLAECAKQRFEIYQMFQTGTVSEEAVEKADKEHKTLTEKLEATFQAYPKKVDRINRVFDNNPWVALMLTWDSSMELDYKTLNRYLKRITFDHMEIVGVEFVNGEWYRELPEEWRN